MQDGETCVVRYLQDGDNVELSFHGGCFKMTRTGETGLSACFVQGERTEMKLLTAGGAGSIPILTTYYRLTCTDGGYTLDLHYNLFSSNNLQTFRLKLNVEISEEK